jgi:glucan 1,3-beta-glucosidase
MRAVKSGDPKFNPEVQRCGADCSATSTRGAVVYFPPGEYLISKPIMQYYFTVFVGHPTSRPTIKGSKNFKGIALMDTDYYIPDKKGEGW